MTRWAVIRGSEAATGGEDQQGAVPLVGAEQGAIHLDVSLVTVPPGQVVGPAENPYEESFHVLSGALVLQLAGQLHLLGPDDHGYVPVTVGHRWENRSGVDATFLRVRSPQPRSFDGAPPPAGLPPLDPTVEPAPVPGGHGLVGHFDTTMLPSPGPLQMRGFRSPTARNVSVWMLVDEVVGAVHHTLFMVQFAPTSQPMTLGGQHYHPFEEIYYIVEGEAVAHLEDERHAVRAGDVVFAGVNALHGFTNESGRPVRWIEAQAPSPPPSNAFFFPPRG